MRPARIDGDGATLVFAPGPLAPLLAYAGPALPPDCDLASLVAATAIGPRENRPDADADLLTILPQSGWGFTGEPAVVLDRPARFEPAEQAFGTDAAVFRLVDPLLRLSLELRWRFLPSGLLSADATIANGGDDAVALRWLASASLPLPNWITEAHEIAGRWSAEFQTAPVPLATGRIEKAGRGGRTGFNGAAYVLLGEPGLREEAGRCIAAHLAWSGDARHVSETLPSGERQVQIGERLHAREVVLSPGRTHSTPPALIAFSTTGLNGIRRLFHAEARARTPPSKRPVHFNTWEAVYFDLDEAVLRQLAIEAAALGAERFVLDDGWFAGRRDDRTSLGDWTPDRVRFPDGLGPLIDHVEALGIDFGLWIEPEMVSPDSALYRAHPDWSLHQPGRPRPTERHQLALDLSRAAVRDHLFARIDRLLRDNRIAYLKWDHNRDLFPVATVRRQVDGLYDLLDRLRAAHPHVDIESCASGGARIDFGVLARTSRVWASDNTDAVARLRIHRGMSLFLPPEVIGAHVGASPNPTTGRRLSMPFRARVALFAHLGVEADPRRLSPADRDSLAAHVTLYKRRRALLAGGVQLYADTDDPAVVAQIVVAADGGEALALLARVDQAAHSASPPVRLPGLQARARYRVTLPEPWPKLAARHLADPAWWRAGPVLSGATLAGAGLRLPLVHPETAWLVHLERL